MMTFPASHKTVFLLDQSSLFAQPCEEIEVESAKSSQSGFPPVSKIAKSIWTSATESVLEYCRIVWDIFPPVCDDWNDHKLIRLVLFNEKETKKVISTWGRKQQNCLTLTNELAIGGRPHLTVNKFGSTAKAAKEKLKNGLRVALQLLTENSEAQENVRNKDSSVMINRGRIVCLTTFEDDDVVSFIEDFAVILKKELSDMNSTAAGSSTLSSIAQLEVNVVCCFGFMRPKQQMPEELIRQVSHSVNLVVNTVPAGMELSRAILEMALRHYELASTTVTGIPMKEEQNASSSANYDVELFHKASAHWRLLSDYHDREGEGSNKLKNEDLSAMMPQTQKEGFRYNTITLKWCTPRGSSADLHPCTALARVTPTDVNSRPSSCLTNFLLSGRSVMLEMPRRSGTKILSHMLTSHGGEIFIHTLNISRSVLEEPPSISEGPGGRVTDYRVPDFGQLMKSNRVAPYFGEVKAKEEQPLDKMRERLARHTKCQTLIISSTTIFNMEVLEPLQEIMVQEELTEENLAECRKIIYSLLSMENRGDMLPVPVSSSISGKGKTMKKDDQYKTMYTELEKYITSHCRTEKHGKVLNCLLESRNKPTVDRLQGLESKRDSEWDLANKELDSYNSLTEREKSDLNQDEEKSLKRNRSPSPGPAKQIKRSNSNESLLDLWMKKQKENSNARFTVPFAGMKSVGEKARLYLSLERKDFNAGGNSANASGSGTGFGDAS